MAVLLPQVVAGLFFVVQDIERPFSFSRQLAAYVQSLPEHRPVLVAQPAFMNYAGPVLSAYVGHPLYYVLGHSVLRTGFTIWDAERARGADERAILNQVQSFTAEHASDVYIVTNNWFPLGLGEHLATFNAGLEGDERSAAVYFYHRAVNGEIQPH
jgi:hypothetical protein